MPLAPPRSVRTLGVDGGATHARVVAVERGEAVWRAGAELARLAWPSRAAAEFRGTLERHGERCVDELASALAEHARGEPLALALCMPGKKTDDERGIVAANRGPVAPDFLERLLGALAERDVRVERAPTRLFSDGRAAAAGELRALGGALVGARQAYYLGAGTGLGECLVLGGELVPLDWAAAWFPKAFALRAASGETFEEELSAAALARRAGLGGFVETRRAAGDPAALEVSRRFVHALAEFLALRVESLAHSPLGALVFERVVLGQRFADLVDAERLFALRLALRERLGERTPALVVSHLAGSAAVGAHVLEESLRS
ncbi:MAG: ROK family protein [Planctomycetes bacterium]|nr:ROK family protein [Planctomycetota bacterium]